MSRSIALEPERIGIGHAGLGVLRPERCHRARLVEPNECIELLRQRGMRVVAQELRLRPVDHTDEALQPRLQKTPSQCIVPPLREIEQKAWSACLMAQPLVAV